MRTPPIRGDLWRKPRSAPDVHNARHRFYATSGEAPKSLVPHVNNARHRFSVRNDEGSPRAVGTLEETWARYLVSFDSPYRFF